MPAQHRAPRPPGAPVWADLLLLLWAAAIIAFALRNGL